MNAQPVLERLTRKPGTLPLVLGHRGARHAAPENTHAAFELARSEGAAGVELDVRLVKSGEIVVLHDPTLTRVTRGADARAVEQLSFAEADRIRRGNKAVMYRIANPASPVRLRAAPPSSQLS